MEVPYGPLVFFGVREILNCLFQLLKDWSGSKLAINPIFGLLSQPLSGGQSRLDTGPVMSERVPFSVRLDFDRLPTARSGRARPGLVFKRL